MARPTAERHNPSLGASGLDCANPQAVPEPASMAAIAVGLAGVLERRRRS